MLPRSPWIQPAGRRVALSFLVLALALGACRTAAPEVKPSPPAAPPPAPAPAVAANPFQGCAVTPLAERSWNFRCGEVNGAVGDDETNAPLLEHAVNGLKESWPGAAEAKEVTLTLAGKERRATRVALRNPKGEVRANATAAELELAPGRHRLVLCVAKTVPGSEARCLAVLEYLAGLPWGAPRPPGVSERRVMPNVLGHELTVPAGCEPQLQGRDGVILCGGMPALAWNVFDDAAKLAQASEALAGKLKESSGAAKVREVTGTPCKVEGVETTCRHYVLDVGGDGRGDMYVGGAEVRGRALLVMCLAVGAPVPHPACAQVLELR